MENINISQQFGDGNDGSDDVHYAVFSQMAAFFGRDMRPHWHDRYFQLHCLTSGKIELQLDDHHYAVRAPLFVLIPPSVPHAFITEEDSDGHVLTVRQELIWPLLQALWPGSRDALMIPGFCLSLVESPLTRSALAHLWTLVAQEFSHQCKGRDTQLRLLSQALFLLLLREVSSGEGGAGHISVRGEMTMFQRFTKMVDEKYREHLTVPEYARELGISESRLNELCRRLANQPPKRLVFERTLREAKRLLLFSAGSVHQIAWQLGYKDPAYFARFFHRLTGCSPSEFRRR
ncbi:MAG TPA: 4-hydroxyphenylacetate catabolism regulatory protein HpaA [Erwinia persicina]|uniref:Arabinose operon regulatory protein n=1 Tax=Erwinia persicina TaxID=55211 RepID=A0A357W1F1_9GAMM|nr:4-hydroxyphenylacetate catabolism regulatory protein HpaA [Erwinia persicina]AXU98231.1 4-hydroxyphenylacetate catabolism regulatory protein HpaA [Erwinia persicina]MBC3947761.1 4-hydroxyphenylacetate catabolism regulatory protein HpaA [Erwinia persicina]MBD8108130.1 4-hydroxyphenylacetate catabolism regulatory protein HpaA [Erwinia persicina]MBD8169648.1 4-hydroxyphenylacetate catabolism regulatory protein HpaA [Erwinia persicina]MBD8211266.1 4-hydroxyphenylacetate catabolism regulatory pr